MKQFSGLTVPPRSHRGGTASRGLARRTLAPIAAAACMLLAQAAAIGARAEEPVPAPDVKVGDRQTYRMLDGFTNERKDEYTRQIVSLSDKEIVTSNLYSGQTTSSLMYSDRAWNSKDTGKFAYDPAFPGLRFPLRAGDSWTTSYYSLNAGAGPDHGIAMPRSALSGIRRCVAVRRRPGHDPVESAH